MSVFAKFCQDNKEPRQPPRVKETDPPPRFVPPPSTKWIDVRRLVESGDVSQEPAAALALISELNVAKPAENAPEVVASTTSSDDPHDAPKSHHTSGDQQVTS